MADKEHAKTDLPKGSQTEDGATVIKKYANRRLYNTETSAYVTLDALATMVKEGKDFAVFDAKSGEDITRSVLTQIIFEEENKGENLLPISFLRQLIGMYGNQLGGFVPSYLEASMEAFEKNQEMLRQNLSNSMAGSISGSAMKIFEDTARQNMAMFQQGLQMFGTAMPAGGKEPSPWARGRPGSDEKADEMAALKARIAELEEALADKG